MPFRVGRSVALASCCALLAAVAVLLPNVASANPARVAGRTVELVVTCPNVAVVSGPLRLLATGQVDAPAPDADPNEQSFSGFIYATNRNYPLSFRSGTWSMPDDDELTITLNYRDDGNVLWTATISGTITWPPPWFFGTVKPLYAGTFRLGTVYENLVFCRALGRFR